ncbi:outer membrane protein transport protein [uncultured Thiohalocapsa sp.]|uniref:OmpP1/FadL family transporter n=1 Tax=uncultured Thiohalocapsa sp. TaxID=768990 RepID=UPI0025D8B4E0|nr:outer membrane protein transport protein [uncultured Thiohalocapsa sp.]
MMTINGLRRPLAPAVALTLALPATAWATNGYFAHGWGTKSKAMAGVAAALPQDTLVTATNPAGMAFLGRRFDVGVAFFHPSDRGYQANSDFATQTVPATVQTPGGFQDFNVQFPAGGFVTPGRVDSDSDWFLIPSIGYNHPLNERSSIGISIYGNGGMNTDYPTAVWENFAPAPNQRVVNGQPVFATVPAGTPIPAGGRVLIEDGAPIPVTTPLPGSENGNPNGILTATANTGVNLEQLFIEVPYTLKLTDNQAFGIAPVFAIQSFEAEGLEPFRAASVNPQKVTNNGKDWSYGAGLHVGWYGEVSEQLALGLSYRTKMWMSDFDDYSGLFAGGGAFDIPAMFNFGLAYKLSPAITLGFDYQHIFYNEIDAISNSNDLDLSPCFAAPPKPSYCLGGTAGLGFGWDSMDVFKLGVRWDQSERWTFFGGASYNTDFLKTDRESLFNVLAPATVRWHLTLGASYAHSANDEFNLAFSYMPKETVNGTSPSITPGQTGSIYMEQMDIEISWNHRF